MSSEPLASGTVIAPGYEVIEHLSRGRRLDVYDAWSEERGCRCVVKAVRPERAHEPTARKLLIREGRLLERLSHPHLVRGYETVLEPAPMIVLETLGGQTLAHMIEEEERELAPAELAHLGLQLGSAIRYLHRRGYLHLDLKPSNVVADAGRAKVIDLSLARPPGPSPGRDRHLVLPGARAGAWRRARARGRRLGNRGGAVRGRDRDARLRRSRRALGRRAVGHRERCRGPRSRISPSWASDDRGHRDYPQLRQTAVPVRSLRELPRLAAVI